MFNTIIAKIASMKKSSTPTLPIPTTIAEEAADYAALCINHAIECGTLVGEDAIINAFFETYELHKESLSND